MILLIIHNVSDDNNGSNILDCNINDNIEFGIMIIMIVTLNSTVIIVNGKQTASSTTTTIS